MKGKLRRGEYVSDGEARFEEAQRLARIDERDALHAERDKMRRTRAVHAQPRQRATQRHKVAVVSRILPSR